MLGCNKINYFKLFIMNTFLKKHWVTLVGSVGIIVILVGLGFCFLPQYLYQGGICAFCGLILFIIAVINNKVPVSTPQSDTSLRDSDTAQVPTAQDAKGAKFTKGDIVLILAGVAVLIVLCITRPEFLSVLIAMLVLTILFLIGVGDDEGCGCVFAILILIVLLLHGCS